MYQNKDI